MMHHTENTVKRQTRFVFDMRTHLLLGFAATVYIINRTARAQLYCRVRSGAAFFAVPRVL